METATPTNLPPLPPLAARTHHTHSLPHTSRKSIRKLEIALAMRLTGSGAYSRPAPVPRMPPGLVQLMDGLARDVLKHNPTDVEEFCARHVEQLLIIRDGQAAPSPTKRRLTLEEKIQRAQEKVKEKADQRRRKYDEIMKKCNDAVSTSSAEESSTKQKDTLVVEEEKSSKGPITETKLKAPVYHDKDLAEALEVEIFHKPVEEVRPFIVNETKDDEKKKEEVSEVMDEDLKQEMKDKEIFESNSTSNAATLDEIDSQGVFEAAIDNASETDGTHTRSQRSIHSEDNGQGKEVTGDTKVEVVEEQINEPENTDKLKETQDHQASTETITSSESALIENTLDADNKNDDPNTKEVENIQSKEKIEDDTLNTTCSSPIPVPNENTHVTEDENKSLNTTEVETKVKVEAEDGDGNETLIVSQPLDEKAFKIDHIAENVIGSEVKDIGINEDQKIDEATAFVNEVLTAPVTTPPNEISHEQINNSSKISQDVKGILEPSAPPADVFDSGSNDSMAIHEKLSDEAHNEGAEEKVKFDEENVGNISTVEKSIVETIHDINENKESNSESVSKLDVLTNETPQDAEHNVVDNDSLSDEADENIVSDENKNVTESDMTTVTDNELAAKEHNKVVIKEETEENLVTEENTEPKENGKHIISPVESSSENVSVKSSELKENGNGISPADEIPVNGSAKDLTNNDEKIIASIEKLEVYSGPIEEIPNENDNLNSNEPTKEVSEKETVSDVDRVIHISASDEKCDDAITTVDKVLVEEPGDIKDDNDAAPEIEIIVNNAYSNTVHVNGTIEPETIEAIKQNGNESFEQEIIPTANDTNPNQGVQIENKTIPEAHDDLTSTSELIKTDIETSSLGKSSSMDDSYIDEGDSLTAVDETKTGTEDEQKKEASGMDLETAAITIQKVFRTFLFKSRESTFDDPGMGGSDSIDGDSEKTQVEFPVSAAPLNKERRTLGISRMDTVLQTVNEEKSLSLSTDESSLSSAATVIQKHVRGFLTRNRLNSNKTNSSSLVNSDGNPSSTSLENDPENKANKTVLNIHIVPEGEHFLSRDESLLTSMELSLDGSPPSSTNLHPLGYDKSEPRKQLKREDAIMQSISPPSNNSGKLSEDVESVKDMPIAGNEQPNTIDIVKDELHKDIDIDRDDTPTKSTTIETVIETQKLTKDISSSPEPEKEDVDTAVRRKRSLNLSSDEGDVVTPFEGRNSTDSDATSRLLHSGEFHDVVLPTKVLRGDTTVVREFKNVLAYFLIWNNS